MTELPTPDPKRARIIAIVDKHSIAMMEELDELHTHFQYPDEVILSVMREEGCDHEADQFQEWIVEEDPERDYREKPDPEGPGGYVTDPGDSDTNRMIAQEQDRRRATAMEMLREAKDVPPTEEP